MKTITQLELNKKLALHQKWLDGEKEGTQLKLISTDLSGLDFSWSDLTGIVFKNSNISWNNFMSEVACENNTRKQ